IHIERLLGRKVFDSEGERIGRLEEVIFARKDGEWVVEEYWVGSGALLHRLSVRGAARALLGLCGIKGDSGYKVPWDKIDLSHPKRLRLDCARHELEKLSVKDRTARQRKRK
ncbi:MAG TPA: PRC-barrel domain-containing protein, partial [Pyrinomonadaceae bacterium]|nr:PRC-barrel domain-containing protein [Pyrinomonadaceae bacterium]